MALRYKQSKNYQDMVIKIPGPKPLGHDIDMGFGRLKLCQEEDSDEKTGTDEEDEEVVMNA